jgi:Cupin-like domain
MQFEWPQLPRVQTLLGCKPENINATVLDAVEPLILKDFGEALPFVKAGKTSPETALDYMQKHYAGIAITTCYGEPQTKGRVFYNKDMSGFNFVTSHQTMDSFVQEFIRHKNNTNPPTLYIPSTNLAPSLEKENNLGLDHLHPLKSIWAGNRTRIAAHYDFPNNIACCVAGKRRFTLFPPDQIINLYPGPLEFAPGGQEISLVDFAAPDFERFPKFKEALEVAQVAELEPGDALFLPGMWWHHVEGLEPINVLYTHWWRDSPAYLGRPTNALLHAVMSLRNLSTEQRKAWKEVFNYYVFDRDEKNLENIPNNVRGMLNLPISNADAQKVRTELYKRLKI